MKIVQIPIKRNDAPLDLSDHIVTSPACKHVNYSFELGLGSGPATPSEMVDAIRVTLPASRAAGITFSELYALVRRAGRGEPAHAIVTKRAGEAIARMLRIAEVNNRLAKMTPVYDPQFWADRLPKCKKAN